MIVMVLDRVPRSLRGEMSRWMLEVHPGVFVGSPSAMVRDRLWEKACSSSKAGSCILVRSADCEQGFAVQAWGSTQRAIEDYEGLTLVRMP